MGASEPAQRGRATGSGGGGLREAAAARKIKPRPPPSILLTVPLLAGRVPELDLHWFDTPRQRQHLGLKRCADGRVVRVGPLAANKAQDDAGLADAAVTEQDELKVRGHFRKIWDGREAGRSATGAQQCMLS
jgi:hypothetical protein